MATLSCAPRLIFRAEALLLLSHPLPLDHRLVRVCRIAAFVLSAAILAAGLIVLAGWAFGFPALTTFGARGVAMNPLTAVCFVLLAVALQLLLPGSESEAEVRAARVLAGAATAAAIVKLASLASLNGPDAWMFRESINAAVPVNRMAPNTAMLMALVGAAVFLLDVEAGEGRRPTPLLIVLAMPVTFVVLVGFLFRVEELSGWGAYLPMARSTALAFVGLELAVLAGRVEHGVTRIFVSSGSGGVTARRLLPAAVLLPLSIGYGRLQLQRLGYYGPDFGVVLFSLLMVAALTTLVWWTASDVGRRESARAEVEERLELLIRHAPFGIVVLDLDGRVQLCNDAFVELFHYQPSELLGQKVDELIAPRDDEGETAWLTTRGVSGESVRRATVRRRRDNELVEVEVFVVPLTSNGRPAGTYGFYRDLTEQRRAEARRRGEQSQ